MASNRTVNGKYSRAAHKFLDITSLKIFFFVFCETAKVEVTLLQGWEVNEFNRHFELDIFTD